MDKKINTWNGEKHPYAWRTHIRGSLPWFLINLGLAGKKSNCENVGASHVWYNIDGKYSGCYHCLIKKEGQLWKKPNA
ncbi:MAG: hypothetical protein HEP71_10935 [Roseivirga sp.]|nr:hypothetical protein [Roseivirga sp.]